MTCEEAREAFTDLYDGTLSGPPLAELSHHMDACPACREEWESFRAGLRALGALRDAEPEPGFAMRVAARIEAPSVWRRLREALFAPPWPKMPLHAAALAVLVLAGVWLVQREPAIRQAAEVRPPASPAPAAPVPAPSRPTEVPLAAKEPAEPAAEPRSPTGPTAAPRQPAPVPAPSAPARGASPAAKAPARPQAEVEILRDGVPAAPGPAPAPDARALVAERQKEEAARQERSVGLSAKARAPLQAPPPAFDLPARRAESPIGEAKSTAPAAIPQAVAPSPPPPPAAVVPRESERPQGGGGSADDLFSGAATAYANGQHEAAVQGFSEFLAQHGSDRRAAEARYFLASAYLASGRFAEAGAEFDTFLQQNPGHRRAPAAFYHQAEARLGAGDAGACRSLRSALDRYPQEREAATAKRLLAERCQ